MQVHNRRYWVILITIISCGISVNYAATSSTSTTTPASILGWTTVPSTDEYCDGYYVETPIQYPFAVSKNPKKSPLDIQSHSTHYAAKGKSLLQGNVRVTQPNIQLRAERAYLIRDPQTGKINVVQAFDNVRLSEPGRLLQGSEAHVTLNNKTWHIKNPTYRLVLDNHYKPHIINPTQPYNVYELSGWGIASDATKQDNGHIVIHNGTFSTCAPDAAEWHLRASTIDLDRQRGRGSSYNNVLYIKNVPVFYLPYANFPIDDQRKTGFLYPTFNLSKEDGIDIAAPFYWNIAPNYDATLTPHFVERRGARFDGLFRYLLGTPSSTGNVSGIWLPHDRKFGKFQKKAPTEYSNTIPANNDNLRTLKNDSTSRGFIHADNTTQFNPHWHTYAVFNYTTDDYFSEDFSTNVAGANDKQLLQQARINYSDDHWRALANVQAYQTLHPLNQPAVSNSYTRLPQFSAAGQYPDTIAGTDLGVDTDFTNFVIERNPGQRTDPVSGQRYHLKPSISLPITWGQAAYITPAVQLDTTTYQLVNTGNLSRTPQRTLPILDVDAGLVFERTWHRQAYQQTLEPRLFYLYVPYKNQNDIPVFDTGVRTFNVNQLHATNRFTGFDRLGDANQVAYSLTTRLLNTDSGNEIVTATIGQIAYFRNRRVQLCTNNSDACSVLQPDARRSDGTSDTDSFSPVAGNLQYHLTDVLSVHAGGAWEIAENKLNNATVGIQYKKDEKRIINLGYSFLHQGDIYPVPAGSPAIPTNDRRNNLSQINTSAAWPIWRNWSAIGRFNYNISHKYAQDYFYGVQYDSCCWAIRVISSRYLYKFNERANPEFKQRYYLQFLFKGVGAVGTSNKAGILSSGIQNYVDPFNKKIM